VGRDLSIIERAVLELLEPFGFEFYKLYNSRLVINNRAHQPFKVVHVDDDMVKLYMWENSSEDLLVCLCDPDSFRVIEGWAGGCVD